MCRLLAYIGSPVSLEHLLYNHENSLIVQSYQPKEMIYGNVSVDGFGIGWYDANKSNEPFIYKSVLPIWNDINLPELSRYVESECILSYIRSATPGQGLDLSNSQPFRYKDLLFTHNGKINNFRQTLYIPIREELNDEFYKCIDGTTDSEHIFAFILNYWQANPSKTLEQVLSVTLLTLKDWAQKHQTYINANLVLSDGNKIVASRFSSKSNPPSLYWLEEDSTFSGAVVIASEPLFEGKWTPFPKNSIMSVGTNLEIQIQQI
ncbi:MAG: ergothioneine biosynthesis protein EgtC [Mastigocoleus sp. MO_167.B18]|uniref:ergothioneine biosynthesis protein EgtC n=1 Tax=Mastigocoleus sp. MO_188.B34 TaxID=3036635 RepID=UPI00261EF8A4|nr:ergothioneine biosynthesis protein EgtC [Mastigocoleus sp. MO_188.B34]MDJ0693667.1 ergothioneine biosynthesis protein EgtC [Mastigocoleus sp. MO_188.B34]MDJ0773386.1 ergothioneine biosynthesis protein EgtC [Mastigocoleus sp. MO_167.B18]